MAVLRSMISEMERWVDRGDGFCWRLGMSVLCLTEIALLALLSCLQHLAGVFRRSQPIKS